MKGFGKCNGKYSWGSPCATIGFEEKKERKEKCQKTK